MDRREMLRTGAAGVAFLAAAKLAGAQGRSAGGPASPHPIGEDCVCNHTGEDVVVHIVSKYGHTSLDMPKDTCALFKFTDDGKSKVLAAFTKDDNELVTYYPFIAINNPSACLPVSKDVVEVKALEKAKRVEKGRTLRPADNKPV